MSNNEIKSVASFLDSIKKNKLNDFPFEVIVEEKYLQKIFWTKLSSQNKVQLEMLIDIEGLEFIYPFSEEIQGYQDIVSGIFDPLQTYKWSLYISPSTVGQADWLKIDYSIKLEEVIRLIELNDDIEEQLDSNQLEVFYRLNKIQSSEELEKLESDISFVQNAIDTFSELIESRINDRFLKVEINKSKISDLNFDDFSSQEIIEFATTFEIWQKSDDLLTNFYGVNFSKYLDIIAK